MTSAGSRRSAIVAVVLLSAIARVAPGHAAQKAPAPSPTRVYVFTDPTGDAADLRDRQQSVKDLRTALSRKKKTMTIVDDDDRAEIRIDVLTRTTEVPKFHIGFTPAGPPGVAGVSGPVRVARLRVKIARPDADPVELVNKNSPSESQGGFISAAEDLASQIEKWIFAHPKG